MQEIRGLKPVAARTVTDLVDVVILVNDHRGLIATAGVRHRQFRALADVDDSRAIESVPVHPDDQLLVNRRWLSNVIPG